MRILFSFILSVIIYCFILLFLYFTFFKHNEKKEVLIHTAIITPEISQKKLTQHIKKTTSKFNVKKESKKITRKSGSKKNITKSGNVNFNDIFKNVNYNVPTKKVSLKKEDVLSRFKAKDILKKVKDVKDINVNISYNTSSNVKKEKVDELVKKIGNIWDEISDIPGEYATIKFINQNGKVFVYILESNLDMSKQQILLEKLKNIQFDKNIELKIKLQTKVNG